MNKPNEHSTTKDAHKSGDHASAATEKPASTATGAELVPDHKTTVRDTTHTVAHQDATNHSVADTPDEQAGRSGSPQPRSHDSAHQDKHERVHGDDVTVETVVRHDSQEASKPDGHAMQIVMALQHYVGMVENNTTRYYRTINTCLDSLQSVLKAQEEQFNAWLTTIGHNVNWVQVQERDAISAIERQTSALGATSGAQRSQAEAGRHFAKPSSHQSQHGRSSQ